MPWTGYPTVLTLSGMGISPYSARGLKQTLEPIGQASQLRRTVNGLLVDVGDPIFRKLRTTISGADQRPPKFGSYWPGMAVTVGCLLDMAGTADKPVVSGSTFSEEGVTFFRYSLACRIVSWSIDAEEWSAGVSWALTCEES